MARVYASYIPTSYGRGYLVSVECGESGCVRLLTGGLGKSLFLKSVAVGLTLWHIQRDKSLYSAYERLAGTEVAKRVLSGYSHELAEVVRMHAPNPEMSWSLFKYCYRDKCYSVYCNNIDYTCSIENELSHPRALYLPMDLSVVWCRTARESLAELSRLLSDSVLGPYAKLNSNTSAKARVLSEAFSAGLLMDYDVLLLDKFDAGLPKRDIEELAQLVSKLAKDGVDVFVEPGTGAFARALLKSLRGYASVVDVSKAI